MKIQLKSYVLLVFFFFAITFDIYAAEITVGDANLNVPPFSGFSEISSSSNETLKMFQDMCPSTNRLLAVFLTQDDAGKIILGEPAILDRYIIVQSSKEFETLTLTKYLFKEFRTTMRKQFDSLMKEQGELADQMSKKAGDALSKNLNSEVALKYGGVVPLGVDSETTSSIAFSQLAKITTTIDGGKDIESVVAGTATTLLVKGKVIYVYVFKQYHSEEDIEWVRKTAKEYTEQILSANGTTWPLAAGSIVPKGTTVDPITKELLVGDYTKYSLKSHPKALGLDVVLKYPQSWKAKEGNRPHIVQMFTGEPISGIVPSCLVLVQKMPFWAGLFISGEIAEETLTESLQEMMPAGAIFIDSGKTKIDGEPSSWLKYYYESERTGAKAGMYILQYVLFYENKMLIVQCCVGGLVEDKEFLEDAFKSYLPVFQMIGNSIVINAKWVNPVGAGKSEYPVMKGLFGEYWFLTLLVSAILTWGIGLTPPILIRYAILRRPLPKKAAIPIVVFFCFVNILIFTALGSQSKTHGALFLVALASYYILHRGYSTWPLCGQTVVEGQKVPKNCGNCKFSEKDPQASIDGIPDPEDMKCHLTGYNYNRNYICTKWRFKQADTGQVNNRNLEKCSNCTRTIGKLEHSYKIEGDIVCVKCYQRLTAENN